MIKASDEVILKPDLRIEIMSWLIVIGAVGLLLLFAGDEVRKDLLSKMLLLFVLILILGFEFIRNLTDLWKIKIVINWHGVTFFSPEKPIHLSWDDINGCSYDSANIPRTSIRYLVIKMHNGDSCRVRIDGLREVKILEAIHAFEYKVQTQSHGYSST